jgi:hypothetical protein
MVVVVVFHGGQVGVVKEEGELVDGCEVGVVRVVEVDEFL